MKQRINRACLHLGMIEIIGKSKYEIQFLRNLHCYSFPYDDNISAKKITFHQFQTVYPKEVEINNDVRKLGVAIKSIEVK